MRATTLITLSLLCFIFTVNAQNLAPNSSNNCRLGKMLNAPQTTIKKNFVKIRKIKSLLFEAVTVTNINSSTTESGLRISGTTGRNYAPTMSAYIDEDELDEFIQAINHMMVKTINIAAPQNTVEYKYQSRSGFCTTTFNAKRILSKSKKWHVSVKLIENLSQSEFLFNDGDLYDIKSAAEQAKIMLAGPVLTAK